MPFSPNSLPSFSRDTLDYDTGNINNTGMKNLKKITFLYFKNN